MMPPGRRTAPVGVRITALSATSVSIGTAAHSFSFARAPGLVALLAATLAVGILVLCLVLGGRVAATEVRRLGADLPVEDAAAGASLVVGQFVVHWCLMLQAPGSRGDPMMMPMGMSAAVPELSAPTGSAMVASHALAALLVGCLLRWVEAGIVRCVDLVSHLPLSARAAARLRHLTGGSRALIPAEPAALLARPRSRNALLPVLRVALSPVERRGPPATVVL